MSDLIYLDLIESQIYKWMEIAFNYKSKNATDEHLCLHYTDIVNGEEKSCILYLEPEFSPFDKISLNMNKDFPRTKFYWKAIISKIRIFIIGMVNDMNDKYKEFFEGMGIADEFMCMNVTFYPKSKEHVLAHKDIYPNNIAIEESEKMERNVFQWYLKKLPRLSVKVELSDDPPPEVPYTTLL